MAVRYAFSAFFPNLKFEAVETLPASGIADIQFMEVGNNYSVPVENVGAGIAELLTILTNLITFRRHIFVIEEPELHLHPHAKRSLERLILLSATRNQVFTVTHDPVFVNPEFIGGLKRLYTVKGKKTGTVVASLSDGLGAREMGQIATAMKDTAKRELVFARAVLFVEDESHQRFITACAPRLDYDLNSAGLSVIEVGGSNGFAPYIKLAEQLGLPFMCLADLKWGADKPPKIYRALGCELEEYLEEAGFGVLMSEGKKAVGTSKQRVAKYCGEHIECGKIPQLFIQLLEDAVKLTRWSQKQRRPSLTISQISHM